MRTRAYPGGKESERIVARPPVRPSTLVRTQADTGRSQHWTRRNLATHVRAYVDRMGLEELGRPRTYVRERHGFGGPTPPFVYAYGPQPRLERPKQPIKALGLTGKRSLLGIRMNADVPPWNKEPSRS